MGARLLLRASAERLLCTAHARALAHTHARTRAPSVHTSHARAWQLARTPARTHPPPRAPPPARPSSAAHAMHGTAGNTTALAVSATKHAHAVWPGSSGDGASASSLAQQARR